MNGFERAVKHTVEPYEVPYNSADWTQLEQRLSEVEGTGRLNRSGLYALLFGGSIAAASSLFALLSFGDEPLLASTGSGFVPSFPMVSFEGPSLEQKTAPWSADDGNSAPLAERKKESNIDRAIIAAPEEEPPVPAAKVNMPGTTGSALPMVRASITEGCPGTVIEFATENLPDEGIYLWNFGDGSFSNKPTPSHAFAKSGSFEVMLSHSSRGGGNIHNKPAADRILIHEAPEASFTPLKQEYDNTVPSVHFENRSQGGRSYVWDFGDGTTSKVAHPDHVYKKGGQYTVTLTVTNEKGCIDRAERTVKINEDYDLLAVKTFSPNGDGVEDLFIPEALKSLGVKFNLSIFDSRTGAMVYETADAKRPWNGRLANKGEPCPPGDYVWMVEMKDGEKLGGTYNGSLNLVR